MSDATINRRPTALGLRTGFLQRLLLVALVFAMTFTLVVSSVHAASEVIWPEFRLPEELALFAMGQTMTVDGLPMRLQGFVSRESPAKLAEAVRRSFGQPVVESNRGATKMLGRAEGRFYLTVQIESSGTGSKGVVATTDLGQLAKRHEAIAQEKARWLDRLPAGSTIASDMRSADGGKEARHTVIVNDHGSVRNRDAIVSLLANEGYVLEREAGPPADSVASKADTKPTPASRSFRDAATLYFRAPGKEAMAVIARTGTRTAVVLNTVSSLKAEQ